MARNEFHRLTGGALFIDAIKLVNKYKQSAHWQLEVAAFKFKLVPALQVVVSHAATASTSLHRLF